MLMRILIIGTLLLGTGLSSARVAWAGSQATTSEAPRAGDSTRGRELFNGAGICHYCHGVDGFLDRRPQLAPDTQGVIARLHPPPPDLRSPNRLRLKNDKARFRAIRHGHPGTGMFPDTKLTDGEITDLLAYLATLRAPHPAREGFNP